MDGNNVNPMKTELKVDSTHCSESSASSTMATDSSVDSCAVDGVAISSSSFGGQQDDAIHENVRDCMKDNVCDDGAAGGGFGGPSVGCDALGPFGGSSVDCDVLGEAFDSFGNTVSVYTVTRRTQSSFALGEAYMKNAALGEASVICDELCGAPGNLDEAFCPFSEKYMSNVTLGEFSVSQKEDHMSGTYDASSTEKETLDVDKTPSDGTRNRDENTAINKTIGAFSKAEKEAGNVDSIDGTSICSDVTNGKTIVATNTNEVPSASCMCQQKNDGDSSGLLSCDNSKENEVTFEGESISGVEHQDSSISSVECLSFDVKLIDNDASDGVLEVDNAENLLGKNIEVPEVNSMTMDFDNSLKGGEETTTWIDEDGTKKTQATFSSVTNDVCAARAATSETVECPALSLTHDNCHKCLDLQKQLKEEQQRCKILRSNIHKVSANWFQRKSQLSESEYDTAGECHTIVVNLLNETTKIADEDDHGTDSKRCDGGSKSLELSKYIGIISQKSEQLDLAESQCRDLKKRMREYEKIIDDKDDIIHGLKDQLLTYLNDNQTMSIQLHKLTILFQHLEKVDKESVSAPQVEEDNTEPSAVPLPTQDEFREMASSVSRTYIKLKDLIYEKKALVTEIERLNILNVELQRRVLQQETRLLSVSDALHQTWLVVSDLKEQHTRLHDDELIMKYELKQKREILTKLRKELESSRAQWQIIRQKNLESEQEYNSIRQMLQDRKKAADEGTKDTGATSSKSEDETDKQDLDKNLCLHPDDAKSFDPPIDLLLEMGLEYGIIGEDAEMTKTVLKVIQGEDVKNSRLEQLEEHCSLLYQKLLASTSRSLSLASRLTRLHRHYGSDDDEDDDLDFDAVEGDENDHEEEGEGYAEESEDQEGEIEGEEHEEVQYLTDANHMAVMESVLSNSPDSEGYDTAYVSETDPVDVLAEVQNTITDETTAAGPSTSTGGSTIATTTTENAQDTQQESSESSNLDLEESCDHLSRALINFLPKKIEFLKKENGILQDTLTTFKEEVQASEDHARKVEKEKKKLEEEMQILTKEMTLETIQRKQLEEQLKHLGKCVDQLKLNQQREERKSQESNGNGTEEDNNEEGRGKEEGGVKRTEEEKQDEAQRIKKEVDMVKKNMELHKKEKQLKKKEEELRERETKLQAEMKGPNSNNNRRSSSSSSSSNNNSSNSSSSNNNNSSNSSSNNNNSSNNSVINISSSNNSNSIRFTEAMFKIITSMVMQKIEEENEGQLRTIENRAESSITTGTIPIAINSSPTQDPEHNSTKLQQHYSRMDNDLIKVQRIVVPEEIRNNTTKVNVVTSKVLVIPIHIPGPREQLVVSVYPSVEITLLVLQISNPTTEHSTHSTESTANTTTQSTQQTDTSNQLQQEEQHQQRGDDRTDQGQTEGRRIEVLGRDFAPSRTTEETDRCCVLVPSSRVAASSSASVTLQAVLPSTFVVLLSAVNRTEKLTLCYTLATP